MKLSWNDYEKAVGDVVGNIATGVGVDDGAKKAAIKIPAEQSNATKEKTEQNLSPSVKDKVAVEKPLAPSAPPKEEASTTLTKAHSANHVTKPDFELQSPTRALDNAGSPLLEQAQKKLDELDVPSILQDFEMGAGRVRVDQKAMINCRADVNQLVPFKYDWAWDKYLNACANHWMPQEVGMAADKALWNQPQGLSKEEKQVIKRSLGFFSTADSLVANNLVLAVYQHITNPECRQYLLRQAFEEAIHTHAYQYCIQSLGMDESELFNMYREIPSVAHKAAWAIEHTRQMTDPRFRTGTLTADRHLLRNLVAFYAVVEGIFFYCGFSLILSMKRNNKMVGTGEQIQYIMRDESMHMSFGMDMINQIKLENPRLWDAEMQQECVDMIVQGTALEIQFARDTMPGGILGMNAEVMEEYLQFIANRRLEQLNLPPQFEHARNTLPWMSEVIDLPKEKNFFESRVTEYQVGGSLQWD